MRFVNMLHNYSVNGAFETETGVYNMGDPALGQSPWVPYVQSEADQWVNPDGTKNIYRHKDAKYFLPSRDEWYKAAYYKGGSADAGYWNYATQSDVMSIAEGPSTGSNSANYGWMSGQGPGGFTDAGSYPNSVGAYGTIDQNGNASEWAEPTINGDIISAQIDQLGFRIASVKESVIKAPVFTPSDKYLTSPTQAIAITCETSGASIYYTTDGTFPTNESTLYAGPVTVSDGTRIGFQGIPISPVAHGAYYLGGWLPCFDNTQVIEAACGFVREMILRYCNHPAL